MDLKMAYRTLEMPESSTDEELKAQHKRLIFQYHPDRNTNDPTKLRDINEAYQYIQEYKSNPPQHNPFSRSPFGSGGGIGINLNDLFGNGFGGNEQQKQFNYPPINVSINVSFKDSVLGTNKEIQFKKHIKCSKCSGQGRESVGNGCAACGGKGRIMSQQGNMMFSGPCNKCYGKNMGTKACDPCHSIGTQEVDAKLTISVPAGIENNSTMRLKAAGNYMGQSIFGDAATDVFVNVKVEPEEGLTLEGSDVVSHLRLSLLEALVGSQKNVKTIHNTILVIIPPGTKNKEEIDLPGMGVVSANGKQRVVLDIDYPDDKDNLIEFLKSKEN